MNVIDKLELSEGNNRYFATRCQQLDISRLRELNKGKALTYLVCFIATRFRVSNDSLTQSFLVAYKDFDDRSKEYRDDCVRAQALELLADIENIPPMLDLFTDKDIQNNTHFGDVRDKAFGIIPEDQIPRVSQQFSKAKFDKNIFQWQFVDAHVNQLVKNIRPLLMALEIGCRDNPLLQKQVHRVKSDVEACTPISHIDKRLVKKSDKKYLTSADLNNQENVECMANRSELYLYALLYSGIGNGDVYVENSQEYRSFDDYLVDDDIWNQRDKYLEQTGLEWMSQSSEEYFGSLKTLISEKIASVSQRIIEGQNSFIKRKAKSNKLLWSKAVTPKDEELTERFFSNFDRKTIVNVIRKVNEETEFFQHLKPVTNKNKKSTASLENLLACIIANGTFQGTHKFAAISDQQYKVLKRIEEDCLHEDALRQANDAITGAAVRLSIFEDFHLDDGKTHSSADGQRYESKYGNPLVGHAAKYYGRKKGAVIYTLVASHFATHGKVIPARSHESHYLFDIVYNNTSDLKANIISTNTHGTNQFNHAILGSTTKAV
ncbi:MAG: Tn3 family transposase [Pseudomonadales bacterium]|nr:Tn3 family transposase [Pseudomonadales bacterium]